MYIALLLSLLVVIRHEQFNRSHINKCSSQYVKLSLDPSAFTKQCEELIVWLHTKPAVPSYSISSSNLSLYNMSTIQAKKITKTKQWHCLCFFFDPQTVNTSFWNSTHFATPRGLATIKRCHKPSLPLTITSTSTTHTNLHGFWNYVAAGLPHLRTTHSNIIAQTDVSLIIQIDQITANAHRHDHRLHTRSLSQKIVVLSTLLRSASSATLAPPSILSHHVQLV